MNIDLQIKNIIMKTLTKIWKTEKHLKIILIIALFVFHLTIKASEVPAAAKEVSEMEELVEDWMLDLSSWAKSDVSHSTNEIIESEMEIEEWMTNPDNNLWKTNFEEEFIIETWMSDANHNNWDDCTDDDEEISIEEWMMNPSEWLSE